MSRPQHHRVLGIGTVIPERQDRLKLRLGKLGAAGGPSSVLTRRRNLSGVVILQEGTPGLDANRVAVACLQGCLLLFLAALDPECCSEETQNR